MSYIFELDLPKIDDFIIDYAKNIKNNKSYYQDNIFPYNIIDENLANAPNANIYNFCAQTRISNLSISKKIIKQFSGFRVNSYLVFNYCHQHQGKKSFMIPHCDSFRQASLNYIIDTGGSNVYTSFFSRYRSSTNLDLPEMKLPNEFENSKSYKFEENKWYIFDTQEFHSVSGIENCRILLMVDFIEITKEEFFHNFKNIFKALSEQSVNFKDLIKDSIINHPL